MLKFIDAVQYSTKLKATIQSTGKLGFTKETAEILQLSTNCSIQFARDDKDKSLYMAVYQEINPQAFRVNKAGEYFYLSTKYMFDDFGIDYKNQNIMYDLIRAEAYDVNEQCKVYLMSQRFTERRRTDEPTEE